MATQVYGNPAQGYALEPGKKVDKYGYVEGSQHYQAETPEMMAANPNPNPTGGGFVTGNSTPVNVTSQGTTIGQTPQTPQTTPGAQPSMTPYTVKPGDTVSQIAKQFGVNIEAISGYGKDINKIVPGQSLSINNSPYQKTLSMLSGKEVPSNPAEAMAQISQAMPVEGAQQPPIAQNLFSQDPVLQQMQQQFQQFMGQQNQQKTLVQQYQDLANSTGLQSVNLQLANMKSIIDGTPDDIRTEIEKANGFATDSQVQALAAARNKVLIQNYNNLLNQRNSMQDYVDKLMTLSQEDKQLASQQFDRMMNFEKTIYDYALKAQDNAQQMYSNIGKTYGYGALMTGDKAKDARTESLLNLPKGGLAQLAQIDEKRQMQQATIDSLKLREQAAQTKLAESKAAEISPEALKTKKLQQLSGAETQINAINGLLKDPNLEWAVGPSKLSRTGIITGGVSNFIAGVEQVRSQLTLDKLIEAKNNGATFGSLEAGERIMLQNAATKIGSWAITNENGKVIGYAANESDFKTEIDKINNLGKLDYVLKGGDPQLAGLHEINGHLFSTNWDGSVTQIK